MLASGAQSSELVTLLAELNDVFGGEGCLHLDRRVGRLHGIKQLSGLSEEGRLHGLLEDDDVDLPALMVVGIDQQTTAGAESCRDQGPQDSCEGQFVFASLLTSVGHELREPIDLGLEPAKRARPIASYDAAHRGAA